MQLFKLQSFLMGNVREACPIGIPQMIFNENRADLPNRVGEIMNWISENRMELDGLVQSLDRNIGIFNQFGVDDFDQSYQNFHLVKGILGGVGLPTVEGLLKQAQKTPEELKVLSDELDANPKAHVILLPLLYAKTLKRVGIMMRRGDEKRDGRETNGGPTIGYQNTETDPKTLVIASVFQVYEETVKALPQFSGMQFEPDRIIEALMEVSTEDARLTQALFRPLASSSGMDWVRESSRFTQPFKDSSLSLIK